MALRIVLGWCILCAAYCMIDPWLPGLLPHITVAARMGAPASSPAMASASEEKDSSDVKGADLEAFGIDETCSTTQGDQPCAHKDVVKPPKHNDSFAVRVWWKALFLLSEHLLDAVVPPDSQTLLRDTWTALKNVERSTGVGCYKSCLLVAFIFCFFIVMRCCKRGPKKNTSDAKPSPPTPLHATTVEWKSNFSISEMARLNIRGNEDEIEHADFRARLEHDTVLIEDPRATIQLSRKEAAATVIQRWARNEFKRWRRSAKAQYRSTATPLSSQHGVDYEDRGMIVNTTLKEDALASADELKHSGDEMFLIDTLPLGKRYSDVEDGGCVNV